MGKFNDKIASFIDSYISLDVAYYIVIGLLVLCFILPLFTNLGFKAKFRKGARYIANKSSYKTIDNDINRLPQSLALLYKKAVRMGSTPSDILSVDTAVNLPYFSSFIKNLALTMLVNTLVVALLGYALTKTLTIVVFSLIIGLILALISGIISKCYYVSTAKLYYLMIEKLNDFSLLNEKEDLSIVENDQQNEEKEEEKLQENVPVQTSFIVDMEKPLPDEVEQKEQSFVVENQSYTSVISDDDLLPSTKQIIDKVNDIAINGANISVMKETATLLQLERAKIENRSPSKQKKLNEALASLLKSISNATNH